jgi:hypothetical protein
VKVTDDWRSSRGAGETASIGINFESALVGAPCIRALICQAFPELHRKRVRNSVESIDAWEAVQQD